MGYVTNIEDVLAKHSSATVTSYSTRKSWRAKHCGSVKSKSAGDHQVMQLQISTAGDGARFFNGIQLATANTRKFARVNYLCDITCIF